jgi:hypothetical protein
MRRDKKVWIGILALLGLIAPVSNSANALSTENNLSKTEAPATSTAKAVFLVSKPKSLIAVKKNLGRLAKYQNITRQLTDRELKDLLSSVGFTGKGLVKAWAVAKKETNGRPMAFNGNSKTGDSSLGLFQINMIRDLGPERRAKFGLNFSAELLNPVVNAQIAYHMSNGGKDWSAWHGLTPKTKMWMSKFPK